MRRCVFLAVSLLLTVLLSSQTTPAPNSQPAATIQANVRVVLVDVVVTDGNGNPVRGLTQDDFRVFEDNKEQKIASFKEHTGAPVSMAEAPKLPKDVYTNFTELQNADSVNVILMDALNTQVLDQSFVHQQVLKYLKTIPPGARVAIFTLSSHLRMVQGFTTDSTRLLAALNDPKLTKPRQSQVLPAPAEEQANTDLINMIELNSMQGAPPVTDGLEAVDPENAIKELLAEEKLFLTQQRVEMTLAAFQEMARYLSGFPGRKNVLWVSGAFPVSILPDPDLQDSSRAQGVFLEEIQKTAELCAAAQTAIYPVGAKGLQGTSVYQANSAAISSKRPSLQSQDMIGAMNAQAGDDIAARVGMETVAKNTGGEAFYDTNALGDVLTRVTNLGMHYYTLSYSPTNTKVDSHFRQTRVEVTKGKYKLAYRRGYYATDPNGGPGTSATQDALLPLMSWGLPDMSQLIYTLGVTPVASASAKAASVSAIRGPTTTYTVEFGISLYHMKVDVLPDGKRRIQLEVRVVAYDDSGKPVAMNGDNGTLVLPPAIFAEVQQSGIHVPLELDLPANAVVHLRTGVYDMSSGNAGTLGIRLKTQAAKTDQPAQH